MPKRLRQLQEETQVAFSNLAGHPIRQLLISTERTILNECQRGPNDFDRDPLMLGNFSERGPASVHVNFL